MIRSHHVSAILTTSEAISHWNEVDFIKVLKQAAITAKLSPVGELSVTFQPQGISAVILLAESHVAIHFWPEERKLCIDIHVCDYSQDNQQKADLLAHLLTLQFSENSQKEQWKHLEVTG